MNVITMSGCVIIPKKVISFSATQALDEMSA